MRKRRDTLPNVLVITDWESGGTFKFRFKQKVWQHERHVTAENGRKET